VALLAVSAFVSASAVDFLVASVDLTLASAVSKAVLAVA
jgi:hypothetical protein